MFFNKFSYFIIFSVFLIFGQVLTENNISTEQNNSAEGQKDDNSNSEINEKNKVITQNLERGLIGDIEKLLKVAEILETVGQKVIPALLNTNPSNTAIETKIDIEPAALNPKGIHDGLFHIRDLKINGEKLNSKK